MMVPRTTLREALRDKALLGTILSGDSWKSWRVLLIAAMGEQLTDDERAVFTKLTGRDHEPDQMVEEFIGVIGRRGGKSRAISVLATYIAGLCNHPNLVRGERGVLLIVAQDQRQADVCLDYITSNFEQSPILKQLIEARTQRALKLTNRIDIEVRSSDFRRLRGLTYICVVADELAFWLNENSSNPDSEILAAIRPGLATTNGPLFMISSPCARRGELYSLYSKHYGAKGDPLVLVAQATSRAMNPSLPQSVVERAIERDPASAAAEYGAEFRRDIESFVSIEAVRACVSRDIYERAPQRNYTYRAFADPSGGSEDSFTLCIAHYEASDKVVVVDAIRETRPPFSPEQVCANYAELLKTYRVYDVQSDKYAGIWPVEQFAKFGIRCEQAAKPKSDLYQDMLALLNSRRIELLDSARLQSQLTSLERRSARSGRDSIDHAPGGHDDVANSVAGVSAMLVNHEGTYDISAMGDGSGSIRRRPDRIYMGPQFAMRAMFGPRVI